MVLTSFQVENSVGKACFFQETFLLADTNVKLILKMLFLTFSNIDIKFVEKELTQRSYTIAKVLLTTKRIKLINKKKFVKVALDEESKIFMMYIATLEALPSEITKYILREAQIAALKQNEAPIEIPTKYSDFANIFSEERTLVLPK